MASEELRVDESGSLTDMRVLFFNGPPGSGKDTAAITTEWILAQRGVNVELLKFAGPIKRAVQAMFALTAREAHELFETTDGKAQTTPLFRNSTPRSVLISFSEAWAKPRFGSDIFGEIAFRHMLNIARRRGPHERCHFIFSDSGFQAEYDYIYERVGACSCFVVHLKRDGCAYAGDSRGYIDARSSQSVTVDNSGDKRSLYHTLNSLIASMPFFHKSV